MAFTLVEIQAQIAAYKAASLAVAEGQGYSINGRTMTRANLTEIRNALTYWTGLESDQLRVNDGQSGISYKLAKF